MTTRKNPGTDPIAPLEAAVAAGQAASEKFIRAGQEAMAMTDVDNVVSTAHEQFDRTRKAVFGNYDRITELNRGTFDAFAASFEIVSRGAEAIRKEIADYTQKTLETSVEAGKAVLTCKTVNEVFDRQQAFVTSSLESVMTEGSKLSEMSLTTANEALVPVRAQVKQAFDSVQDSQ